MSEKPILFNTEMVRAILDGRKTVTRRVINPQPPFTSNIVTKENGCYWSWWKDSDKHLICKAPYKVGDLLYVRETWTTKCSFCEEECGVCNTPFYLYRAECDDEDIKWKPSIHMPKEAARIWLKVTDVRVERLHDITEEQALKEGCKGIPCDHKYAGEHGCTDCMNTGWLEPPLLDFMYLWDSIIKKEDLNKYDWNVNPWVWVIEFERLEGEA